MGSATHAIEPILWLQSIIVAMTLTVAAEHHPPPPIPIEHYLTAFNVAADHHSTVSLVSAKHCSTTGFPHGVGTLYGH